MTERINRILQNDTYREHVARIDRWEAERLFCRHDMGHFLDVARIAVILNEKEAFGIDAELIYAAALLHDIGRWQQYESGEDHALVSTRLAPAILSACGFDDGQQEQITAAIRSHRDEAVSGERSLRGLLYRADKLSRPCFACLQEKECHWKDGKKNLTLMV